MRTSAGLRDHIALSLARAREKEFASMRLDRVLSEGEARVALQRLGFEVRDAPGRPGLLEVSHPKIGGARTMTVEQLCFFAEGAVLAEQVIRGIPAGELV
jgi:hypothetical protein